MASMQGGRGLPPLAAVVMAAAVTAAIGFWWHIDRQTGTLPASAPSVAANAVDKPATIETPKLAFEKLIGLWQRPDGGYLIEIRSVGPNGEMKAAYFNPRPINVAKAEAYHDGGGDQYFHRTERPELPGLKIQFAVRSPV